MLEKENIFCSKSHEYVCEQDGNCYIGLTDYAVEQLGDIVFVEMPEVGSHYAKGEIFGTVESVKAASELYMPVSGTVEAINEDLIEKPELLNEVAFNEIWLIKISADAYQQDVADLLGYDEYKEEVE
ncbi:glycine cleavage system protein GcvH [bacterium]|nr:glycine cleavage system protein GcvH [bacterium]